MARNGIELHPVLAFSAEGSRPIRDTASTATSHRSRAGRCAASYPWACISPPLPDLDCGDVAYTNLRVRRDVADPVSAAALVFVPSPSAGSTPRNSIRSSLRRCYARQR